MTILMVTLLLVTAPAQPVQVGPPDPETEAIVTPLPPRPYSVPDELDRLSTGETTISCRTQPAPVSADSSDRYHALLARALLPGTCPIALLVVVPSFEPEWAVYLERHEDGCRVTSARMSDSLWAALGFGEPGEGRERTGPLPKAKLATAPLPLQACRSVEALWRAALRAAKPAAPVLLRAADGSLVEVIPIDGTAYHVSAGDRAAAAHGSSAGPRMRALIDVGAGLAAYARAPESRRARLGAALADDAARGLALLERDPVPTTP